MMEFMTSDDEESEVSLDLNECSVGSSPFWSCCWHAPQLTGLLIQSDFDFLRIHPSLLSQCRWHACDIVSSRDARSTRNLVRLELCVCVFQSGAPAVAAAAAPGHDGQQQ